MTAEEQPDAHCCNFLTGLSEYVDGELDEALCRALEQHLAECPDCRIVVDTLQKTVSLYRPAPDPASPEADALPQDVKERLYLRLKL